MLIAMKLAAVGAAALIGGATAGDVCVCKPNVETISCQDGVSSWPPAACTVQQVTPNIAQERLLCPDGEVAISGGFRSTLPVNGVTGVPRPPLQLAPIVPSGPHPIGYVFAWRTAGATPVKVYITCMVD